MMNAKGRVMLSNLFDVHFTVHWIAGFTAISATLLVVFSLWVERRRTRPLSIDIDAHYIADDEVTWTELLRTLDSQST